MQKIIKGDNLVAVRQNKSSHFTGHLWESIMLSNNLND